MHFWPLGLLLFDGRFEEMVRGFGRLGGELIGSPPLGDEAEVVVDLDDDAGLFPSFALGSILGGGLVRLPSALGENPAAASGGLDEEHVVFVGRKRNNAGHEALALGAVPWSQVRSEFRNAQDIE